MCATCGIDHTTLDIDWGHGAKAGDITKAMDADGKIDTVIVVHRETSTTSLRHVAALGKATRHRAPPASAAGVGWFLIPAFVAVSIEATGSPRGAMTTFVVFYATCAFITWWWYRRKGSEVRCD